MNIKTRLRIVGTNLVLFAILYGLVSFNKEVIRPALTQVSFVRFLSWVFPNFIAAYIISLFFVNPVLTIKPRYSRLIVYMGSLVVFFILSFEELKPLWGASTHYDLYDILASGLGSVLAVVTFELILFKGRRSDRINES